MLSALNSELSFIVLEPENDPTDYEYLQSYNISTDRKSTVPIHISHKVWLRISRDFVDVQNVTHYITSHAPSYSRKKLEQCYGTYLEQVPN